MRLPWPPSDVVFALASAKNPGGRPRRTWSLLRTFAALSRAALLRDGHANLSFTMTVWIGLVTGNNHFVGNLLLELRPKSLEKNPQSHNFLAKWDQEMKTSNRFSGKLSIYPGQYEK